MPSAALFRPSHRPALLVALVTVLVFAPGVTGDFVWDDNVLIRDNQYAQSLGHLPHALSEDFWSVSDSDLRPVGFYRPVVKVAFLLQYLAFGGRPLGFKLVNLALHLGCVLLAFGWISRRLAAAAGPGSPAIPLAAALAVIPFALHPSRPETVSWISGSTDLWMTFAVLVGLTLWDRRRGGLGALAATLALVLAFFAKETAVVVALPLALDAALLRREGGRRRAFFDLAILVGGFGVAAVVRSQMVPLRYAGLAGLGTAGALPRVAASFGMLLGRTFLPWGPSVTAGALPTGPDAAVIYPPLAIAVGLAGAAGVGAVAGWAIRRERLRPWAADLAWFLAPLLPVLNIVPLKYKMLVAERFLYWPLLGAGALLGRALLPALGPGGRRTAVVAVGGAVAVAFAGISASHVGHFQSDRELWTYERGRAPEDPYAAEMLARTLWLEGELALAREVAGEGVRLAPGADERARVAVLWAQIRQEAAADSEQELLLSLRRFFDGLVAGAPQVELPAATGRIPVAPSPATRERLVGSPRFLSHRAVTHARTGDLGGAEQQFRELLSRFPGKESARLNLARVLAWQGRFDAALEVLSAEAGHDALALRGAIERVAKRIAAAGGDPAEKALERGEGLLELGAARLGQDELARLSQANPGDVRPVRARVRAHLAAGEPALARKILEEAQARSPGQASEWEAVARELPR